MFSILEKVNEVLSAPEACAAVEQYLSDIISERDAILAPPAAPVLEKPAEKPLQAKTQASHLETTSAPPDTEQDSEAKRLREAIALMETLSKG